MAKRGVTIINKFVHKREDGTEDIKTIDEFAPEERVKLSGELSDRFMRSLGFEREKASPA